MTKQTDELDNTLDQEQTAATTAATETDTTETDIDDPVIREMKAAEAEIAAEEAAGAEGKTEAQQAQGQPEAKAAGKDKTEQVMVPKPRLDAVLSERDLLRERSGYLQGRNDILEKMVKEGKISDPASTKTESTATQEATTGAAVDPVDTAIDTAEKKKLELADKYDNGEITSRQWKEQELVIDKEIRGLTSQRMEQVRAESRQEAQAVVSANNAQAQVETTALTLQEQHPNVAVIDALLPGVRDGVWNAITERAAVNLASRGVNVRDGSNASRLALIQEKAKLTDNLEAFLPGFKPAAKTEAQGQTGLSETAKNRQAKIDLANSQPPATADLGRGQSQTGELSDADVEGMTEDQIADLLQKAPNLLKRISG